jgi:formylglycine-generating enzyme required for sulfatase activity
MAPPMRRWFLSYNSQDVALMESLEAALRRKDPDAKIFFAPKSLRAGGYWLPQLAEAIAESTIFVLLVGEKGLGPWQVDEYYEARDRRVPIVLVLLEGHPAPGLPFLRQLHWVVTADPASDQSVARLLDSAAGDTTRPGELWRYASPYRGLAAMTEADSDYFLGRERETVQVIQRLAAQSGRLPVLLGNSGVGKSSLAQAGVVGSLKRQAWPERSSASVPWPPRFHDSRHWCFLTMKPGAEPIKSVVETFFDTWQYAASDPERIKHQRGWIELLLEGKGSLSDLLDATQRRCNELGQAGAPAFFIYIDQGEKLYVRSEQRERDRFSKIFVEALSDSRLLGLMSLRADFLGELQKDESLYAIAGQIDVPPLREAVLRDVVSRPAELLAAKFETDHLAADIARKAAEESTKDAGALPLLSYLLDDMWTKMVSRGDGVLRLPPAAMELGGVLAERANAFVSQHPQSEEALRRILTLKLATVHEDGEPTRRRAPRSDFTEEEWRLVSELADHPNRLLVTAASEGGETYAEVAHEAIFRRWERLRGWIAAEREFLAWKTGLDAARRAWQATPDDAKNNALLMGAALTQAQNWGVKRREELSLVDREFIERSAKRERTAKARVRDAHALIYALLVVIILGLIGVINQASLLEQWNWWRIMRPYRVAHFDDRVLTAADERNLQPGHPFRECDKDCPEMMVLPAGAFMMGSPSTEKGRHGYEDDGHGRQHRVTFAKPFAVSKYEVTFADWDACVAVGGCRSSEGRANDAGWGRGSQPLIYVSWDDAKAYVAWLSRMTGKTYRLLSEAEWEYAARAGSDAAYSWGEEIGRDNANCADCGSKWDGRQTAPVGSFAANAFKLHDVHGNVWEWVEDCFHDNYAGAPGDGSVWAGGDCRYRVVRGGGWGDDPSGLRAANRGGYTPGLRGYAVGFRVVRTLTP